MMRALIFREWRESARWAVLAAVVMGGWLAWITYASRPTTPVSPQFTMAAESAFAAAGVMFGLLAMLGDLRRGHFAFTVFRPVPRWKIYLAKFAAAAGLYFLSTSVALAIGAACCAQPRISHAPFAMAMLWPAVYFQIQGLVGVAGSMLIAARGARWIGSRIFPAALPIFVLIFTQVYLSRFVALTGVVLALTATIVAIGAVYFSSNGEFESLPRWARPVAGLFVFAGAGAVVGIVCALASSGLSTLVEKRVYVTGFDEYIIGGDGQPYRQTSDHGQPWLYDLQGRRHVVKNGEDSSWGNDEAYSVGVSMIDWRDPKLPFQFRFYHDSFLTAENYFSTALQSRDNLSWFYVATRRTLEAYDARTGDYAGCLGPDGRFDASGARHPFPVGTVTMSIGRSYANTRLLHSDRTAYLLDLDHRAVREIYQSPAGEPILDVAVFHVGSGKSLSLGLHGGELSDWLPFLNVVVTTPGRVHVRRLDGDGDGDGDGEPMTVPVDAGHTWPYLTVARFKQGGMAVLTNGGSSVAGPAEFISLHDGQLTQQTLPPLPLPQGTPPTVADDLPNVALPPALLATITAIEGTAGLTGRDVGLCLGGAALAVALCLLIARRYRLGRGATITWTILGGLIGLPAALALVCLREKPGRTACPACGRKRPLTEVRCPHCGVAWPVPGDAATDVIEGDRSAA